MTKKLTIPFASENSLRNDIPISTSETGLASYKNGWGRETMIKLDEGGTPPSGKDFNGILYEITSQIVDINLGIPQLFDDNFASNVGGYPRLARLVLDDGETVVVSQISNNTNNPNTNMTGWKVITDKSLVTWTGVTQEDENKRSLTSCYDLSALRDIAVTTDRKCFVVSQSVRGLWLYIDWLDKPDNNATIVRSKFGGCWLFVGRMNSTNDIRVNGAVGDGIADDTDYVRSALDGGTTRFVGDAWYVVTDVALVRRLQYTQGEGGVIYNNQKYPFGDIVNFGISMAVPTVFFNIQHCFDWLSSKRIKSGEAFIKVDDGQYTQDFENLLNHQDGGSIKIVGNEDDPTKCHFEFDNNNNRNFFHVTGQYKIGFINGFSVNGAKGKGDGDGVWNKDIFGAFVRAINGGVIVCGKAMRCTNMYYGIQAKFGASIEANYHPGGAVDDNYGGGFYVSGAGDAGIHAYNASIRCNGAEVHDTYDAGSDLGFGFCAEAGATIECEYALATGNRRAGFYTLSGGSMWAHGVKGTSNKFGALCWGGHMEINSLPEKKSQLLNNETGLYATQQGQVGANGTICTGNTQYGIHSELNSNIDANGTTASDNGVDGYYADKGGQIVGGGITCQRNGRNGLRTDTKGYIYAENITIGDHANSENVKALNCGIIFAIGIADFITTSPDRNVIGNQSAIIYTQLAQ